MRRSLTVCLFALTASACAEGDDAFDPEGLEVRGGKHHKPCPHTIGYWKTHSAYATVPALQIPWPISEDTGGCGMTWYEVLHTPPEGDAWIILAHQWIGAALNWGAGAEMPPDVYDALNWGGVYLNGCAIADEDREAALAYSELLDDYNNGLAGVSCPGE